MEIKLSDGRANLWQWDTGRYVSVDTAAHEVHFSREGARSSHTVQIEDGKAKVPDHMLVMAGKLITYVVEEDDTGEMTVFKQLFDVQRRPKPSDYIYTEQDIKRWEALEKRLSSAEESIEKIVEAGSTIDHKELINRDAPAQHPIKSIEGLEENLYGGKLVELAVDTNIYEAYITTAGKVVMGKVGTKCAEIQTENMPNEFYMEAGKAGHQANGWYTILDQDDEPLEFDTSNMEVGQVQCAQKLVKITLPEGAVRLVVAQPYPKFYEETPIGFPEAYKKDGIFWSRVWRYDESDEDVADAEGKAYETEHRYGLYYWLWQHNVPVKLVGYDGEPNEGGEMYGIYDMTGFELSEETLGNLHAGTITFARIDVKPYTSDEYETLAHIGTQIDIIALTSARGDSATTHKRAYLPEIPASEMLGKTGNVIPAFNVEDGAKPKLLVGGTDFFELDDTYTSDAVKSAVDNQMVFTNKSAIKKFQKSAPEMLGFAKEVKSINLVDPDDENVQIGYSISSSGDILGDGSARAALTGYIPVRTNTPYFLYGNATVCTFNKNFKVVTNKRVYLYGTSVRSKAGRFCSFSDDVEYVRFSASTELTTELAALDNETVFRQNFVMYEFDGELYDFASGENSPVKYLPNNPMWESFDYSDIPNMGSFRWNLVDPKKVLPGTLSAAGEWTYTTDTASSFNRVSGMIPINADTQYHIKADAVYCYDSEGAFISSATVENGAVTLPENTANVRLTATSTTEIPTLALLQDGYGETLDENSDAQYSDAFPVFLSDRAKRGFINHLDIKTGGGSGLTDEQLKALNANTEARHTHDNKNILDAIDADKITEWDGKSDFSGSYNDLTDKPTMPEEYTLPVATADVLGGVKPAAKTDAMTSAVGVDAGGGLWCAPSGGSDENFELINEITVTEDAKSFVMDKDSAGNTFALKEAVSLIYTPGVQSETTVYARGIGFTASAYWGHHAYRTSNTPQSTETGRYSMNHVKKINGVIMNLGHWLSQNATNARGVLGRENGTGDAPISFTTPTDTSQPVDLAYPSGNITCLKLFSYGGYVVTAGTNIKLYGKRV